MNPLHANLADALSEQASRQPNTTAVLWPGGSLGFRSVDTLVWRLSAHLRANGVIEGDVVGHRFASELSLLVTMLATLRIGATVFSVPAHFKPETAHRMLDEAGARALATDLASEPIAVGDLSLRRVPIDLVALARTPAPIDPAVRVAAPTAPWLLIDGSGSTGRSKLIPVAHAERFAQMRLQNDAFPLPEDARLASLAHLNFASVKSRFLEVLLYGGTVVLFDRRRSDLPALCQQYDVTILTATVVHIEALLGSLPADAQNQLPTLKTLYLGSSTISESLRQRIAWQLTPHLHIRYGSNESGLIARATPEQIASTPGTIGSPLPGLTVEIVDPQGRPLPTGQVGQVRVKSPGVFAGYLGDDAATQSVLRDGWFLPGDLARFTADGQLIYCGRSDHMMIMNGINIYPAEIERVIGEHPAVRDAAAMPLPSAIHQDIPVCAVTLHKGAQATESELREYTRARLGARGPWRIVVMEHIPRNELGKLIRPELSQALQASLGGRAPAAPPPPDRQAMRRVSFALGLPKAIDPVALDDWLTIALELPSPQAGSASSAWPPDAGPQRAMLRHCLRLAGALLRAAQVPAFDTGEVLKVDPAPDRPSTWQVTATLPDIDFINERCYTLALQGAMRLAGWMLQRPRTAANTELLHRQIEPLIKAMRQLVITGKSTVPLLHGAWLSDIPFAHLGGGIYQLGWGSRAILTDRSTTEHDSALSAKLARNKHWSAALMAAAGLPAPQHRLVRNREEAQAAAALLGWPVVIKPVDQDGGIGIAVGITEAQALAEAFDEALKHSRRRQVLVEREVAGICHRLFVAQGHLLYAVKRLPKSVSGDGKSTVAQLIAQANRIERSRAPWLRTEPFPIDAAAQEAIARAGFGTTSIPAQGVLVPLRRIESTRWGGTDEDVSQGIHPDNLEIALRAARQFRLSVAGVDIISPDIGRPWHENGAIINEVNFAPLLGGGEISRSHIPEFLKRFVQGDGRIPVEAVVGDDPGLAQARARQQALIATGLRCFVTSHEQTFTDTGALLHLPPTRLAQRCRALLLDERVDALVLAITTDEPLNDGLPVDRITRIEQASGRLWSARAPARPAASDSIDRLLALLRTRAA